MSILKKHTLSFCCFTLFVKNLRDDQDFFSKVLASPSAAGNYKPYD